MKGIIIFVLVVSAFGIVRGEDSTFSIPDRVTIEANSCNLWNKDGEWINTEISQPFATFHTDCKSVSPSDVFIRDMNDTLVVHTDQKVASVKTTIRLRNGGNDIFGILIEDIIDSILSPTKTVYEFETPDGISWGKSVKQELFATTFTVNTINQDPNYLLGSAEISFKNKLTAKYLCDGAKWKVTFPDSTDQLQRKAILAGITVKSVRDADRDSDGKVTRSNCNSLYWFLVVGVPIIGIFVCCGLGYLICKKCECQTGRANTRIDAQKYDSYA